MFRVTLFLLLISNLIFPQDKITNVRATADIGFVIVTYDLNSPLDYDEKVMLGISLDGGKIFDLLPDASGEVGNVITGKGKTITCVLFDEQYEGKTAYFKVTTNKRPGMVWVEGGSFMMGSNDGQSDENPLHKVTLNGFFIDKYEVTQGEYRRVMGDNPSYFKNGDNYPVESVTWHNAMEYARKTGKFLPTEAEWEYAARGGSLSRGYKYSGSNNIDEVAWYNGNSGSKTHPVGEKRANELGIYDMTGNVWEWCRDWYDESYYTKSPERNPEGPPTGSLRVLRGGSWYGDGGNCRTANRDRDIPDYGSVSLGFRCIEYL